MWRKGWQHFKHIMRQNRSQSLDLPPSGNAENQNPENWMYKFRATWIVIWPYGTYMVFVSDWRAIIYLFFFFVCFLVRVFALFFRLKMFKCPFGVFCPIIQCIAKVTNFLKKVVKYNTGTSEWNRSDKVNGNFCLYIAGQYTWIGYLSLIHVH